MLCRKRLLCWRWIVFSREGAKPGIGQAGPITYQGREARVDKSNEMNILHLEHPSRRRGASAADPGRPRRPPAGHRCPDRVSAQPRRRGHPCRAVRHGLDFSGRRGGRSACQHAPRGRQDPVQNGRAGSCARRYLEPTLALAGAKVIVCLGGHVCAALAAIYGFASNANVQGPVAIGGLARLFVFLPHPNARGKRSFAECLTPGELAMLKEHLGSAG